METFGGFGLVWVGGEEVNSELRVGRGGRSSSMNGSGLLGSLSCGWLLNGRVVPCKMPSPDAVDLWGTVCRELHGWPPVIASGEERGEETRL